MAQSDAEGARVGARRPAVGPLDEKDLPEAGRILRLAFGTFLGAPDPETFWGDRDYVRSRSRAAHVVSFGAKLDGDLVGSNFATNWGSFGFFGPLTVRPDLQGRGIPFEMMAYPGLRHRTGWTSKPMIHRTLATLDFFNRKLKPGG